MLLGVDGMTVEALLAYLKSQRVKEELVGGLYRPQPVNRILIAKLDSRRR